MARRNSRRQRPVTFHSKSVRASSPWDVLGNGNRSSGMYSGLVGPNGILVSGFDKLRNLSRDAVRQNGIAARIIDVLVSSVVGTGLKPKIGNKRLKKLWDQWITECDASGTLDFYGMQVVSLRSAFEGGDMFIRLRPRRPEDGFAVPLQLQALEGEMLPTWKNDGGLNGGEVVAGVETFIGRPSAYHFLRRHPGDVNVSIQHMSSNPLETVRVPASEVCHVRDCLDGRIGEIRSLPRITRALAVLNDVDSYTDFEIVRKKVSALFGGFVTTPGSDGSDGVSDVLGEADEEGIAVNSLEPGSMSVLPPGYTVQFSAPPSDQNFEMYVRVALQKACAAASVPYYIVSNDFTGLNDRTVRAVLVEFKRQIAMLQAHILKHQLCRPVWRRFVEDAVLFGAWKPEPGESVEDYYEVEWLGDGWETIHPLLDAQATIQLVRAGIISPQDAITEMGGDPDRTIEEIAAWNAKIDAAGIVLDSDPRNTDGGGGGMNSGLAMQETTSPQQ